LSRPVQNVLMVAFHFPPIAAAGTHRTLNFVRQLESRGYRLGVLTTSSFTGLSLDQELCERVPPQVLVARTPHVDPYLLLARLRKMRTDRNMAVLMPTGIEDAGPFERSGRLARALDYVSRLFNVPDRYSSWIPLAVARGVAAARQVGAELIYSTAPPYSAHVVGLLLARILELPLVIDLRDPWTLNPFHANPYASLRGFDEALERTVVGFARRVILNTVQAEAGYRGRYPELDRFCTINNGIDPELFTGESEPVTKNGRLTLLHVGAIYGRRYPRGLLEALALLRETHRETYERLVIEQIGPVDEGERLWKEARRLGVQDHLRLGSPVPHSEAIRRCRKADGLLLLGPRGSEPEVQVPSKLFEYLAAGRPILALARQLGAIASLLEGVDRPHVIVDPNDTRGIHEGLLRFVALSSESPAAAVAGGRGLERLSYEWLTSLLEAQFHQAVGAVGADEPPAGAPPTPAPDVPARASGAEGG